MAVCCREFANTPTPVNQNQYYELTNQCTAQISIEASIPGGENPWINHTGELVRPQSTCSQSSVTSSVDYAT